METITVDRVKSLKGKTPIINVLSEDSFKAEHIPGSMNVPYDEEFLRHIHELVSDKNRPLILHCSGPSCDASPNAAKALEKDGYKKVLEFQGGLEEWKKAGLSVEGEAVE